MTAVSGDELRELDALPRDAAVEQFLSICHSRRWAESMADSRPFGDSSQLQRTADAVWLGLGPGDWLEALAGHPRIGERAGPRPGALAPGAGGHATRRPMPAARRSPPATGGTRTASGTSSSSPLPGGGPRRSSSELTRRLDTTPEEEVRVAAEEHRRITRLRLERMFG